MGIGRRYYTLAAIFLCALYCNSHYEAKYPERGFNPTSGWRNKWRRKKEDEEEEERRKEYKARKAAQAQASGSEAEREAEEIAREASVRGRGRGRSRRERSEKPVEFAKEKGGEVKREAKAAVRRASREGERSAKEAEREVAKPKLGARKSRIEREMRDESIVLGLGLGEQEIQGEEKVVEVVGSDQGASLGGADRVRKRTRSDLSDDGDDDVDVHGEQDGGGANDEATSAFSPPPTELGSLHKRRANASPEKFDKGRFELQPLKTEQPPKKKAKIENKLDVVYDETGTPRIVSSTPIYQGLPSRAPAPTSTSLAPTTNDKRSTSSTSTTSLTSVDVSTLLLNGPSTNTSTISKPFSLLRALCQDNDLLLHFISYLNLPSLISLYAISKTFHYLFNRHPTAFILSSMRTWAPNADTIFPWRCYQSLCIKDPAKRQKRRLQGKEAEVRRQWDDLRDVPSLKWLQMVVWREGVSRDMIIRLATHGLRCPPGTVEAVKRMWFLMDLPLNAHRIALIRTSTYISTPILHNLTCFFLKTDMHFTDPMHAPAPTNHSNQFRHPNKFAGTSPSGIPLRKMLLAERQLTPLWRVIRGWNWDPSASRVPLTRMDALRLWVRHRYRLPDVDSEKVKRMSIMGVPWWEVGSVGMERTGVAFHNLAPEKSEQAAETGEGGEEEDEANIQIALSHPSITGGGLNEYQSTQLLRQNELLYPHRNRIILTHEKPREPLLRPDELVVKECIRRRLSMHKKWIPMMLYGICDESGYTLPVWTEEELLRMQKGLPPRAKVKKAGGTEGTAERAEVVGKGKSKEKGEKMPTLAVWSTLPPKGSV